MIPENEAARLIEQLERHSRRSRPFLIYGLVAILAGFLILTFHINGLRTAAEAKARDLEVKKTELTRKIDQAGRLASGRYSPTEAPAALRKIRVILAAASETTQELDVGAVASAPVATAAAHKPDAVAPTPPPAKTEAPLKSAAAEAAAVAPRPSALRIFLHIGDKEQFGGAKELQWSLSSASVGDIRIVVPGIEVVNGGDDTLRCLKRQDCERAQQVAALVNSKLRGRSLAIRDLSRTYESARNVRPGTYEVWLAPGPVLVSGQ